MSQSALRKQVHQYIDQVDDSILEIVHRLLEREVSLSEYDLTSEDKKIIDKRIADYKSGNDKGIPASTASKNIRAKLKQGKK